LIVETHRHLSKATGSQKSPSVAASARSPRHPHLASQFSSMSRRGLVVAAPGAMRSGVRMTRVAGSCGRPRSPRFTAEIIDDVERAKAPTLPQPSDMKWIGQLLLIWSPATSGIGRRSDMRFCLRRRRLSCIRRYAHPPSCDSRPNRDDESGTTRRNHAPESVRSAAHTASSRSGRRRQRAVDSVAPPPDKPGARFNHGHPSTTTGAGACAPGLQLFAMTSFKACFPSPARHTCVEFVVLYLDCGGLPLMPSQERRRDHPSDRQVGQTTIGVHNQQPSRSDRKSGGACRCVTTTQDGVEIPGSLVGTAFRLCGAGRAG